MIAALLKMCIIVSLIRRGMLRHRTVLIPLLIRRGSVGVKSFINK